MDIVLKSALQSGILTSADVRRATSDEGFAVDWRAVCRYIEQGQSARRRPETEQIEMCAVDRDRSDQDRAGRLRRFAAELYGFQSMVICEVGTLVLAHLLERRLTPEIWKECFRLDCIPVAPHGKSISSTGRLMLASPDPARGAVRNLSRSVIPGDSTLVYADVSVITALKSLLVSELRHVALAVDSDTTGRRRPQNVPDELSTSSFPAAA